MKISLPPMTSLAPAAIALIVSGCSADANVDEVRTDYFHVAAARPLVAEPGFSIPREFAGLVASRQSSDLAFELSGELEQILVDEGDPVIAGQLLASLDTRLLEAQREDLIARRADLESQLSLNVATRGRADELQTRGFTAEQRIDELESERRSLIARLAQLDAEMSANSTRMDQSRLVAPFDGAIARRLVDSGAVISPGVPVLQVIENAGAEARVGVPVRLLGSVRVGQDHPVRVGSDWVDATVIAVGSDVTRATLTVPVRLALPADLGAVPGDQAYLQIVERVEESGFWVPMTALTDGMRGVWNVYIVVPGVATTEQPLFTVEARDVRVVWADDERAFVRGAIAEGEWLVEAGLQRLVPGQRVRKQFTQQG